MFASEEAEETNDEPKWTADLTFFRGELCSEYLDAASCLMDEKIADML
jgi:hypothetical protein